MRGGVDRTSNAEKCQKKRHFFIFGRGHKKNYPKGVFIGFFAFEIQGLGPKGFCSSIMETTLYETIRSGVLTEVVHGEVQKSRFGNVLRDVIVIRLFNFLTLNY